MELVNNIKEIFTNWTSALWGALPSILLAVGVVVLFYLLSGVTRKIFNTALKRTKLRVQIKKLISTLAGVIILIIGLFLALQILDLDQAVTSLLAGAGIVGIAIGFAFQDMLSNFIAGVMLASKSPFRNGDYIETNGFGGFVKSVDLRYTKIVTLDGKAVYIPNKEIFENALVNFSSEPERRIEVEVGVAYESDLKKVEKTAMEAVKKLHNVKNKKIEVQFTSFGGSSIDLIVKFWVDSKGDLNTLDGQSEAIKLIHEAFEKNGIGMPFPMRTLEIQGLEKLIK